MIGHTLKILHQTLQDFQSMFDHFWDIISLILSCRKSLSYRNHSIDLQSKSLGPFLYKRNLRHQRVNGLKDRRISLLDISLQKYYLQNLFEINTKETNNTHRYKYTFFKF